MQGNGGPKSKEQADDGPNPEEPRRGEQLRGKVLRASGAAQLKRPLLGLVQFQRKACSRRVGEPSVIGVDGDSARAGGARSEPLLGERDPGGCTASTGVASGLEGLDGVGAR